MKVRRVKLAIGNKPLSLRSCHEAQNTFFVIQVFHIFILFSSSEKKRKDYYRYLRQWVIETFIITQPYKLCTKREAKVEMALPRKIAWLITVCQFVWHLVLSHRQDE